MEKINLMEVRKAQIWADYRENCRVLSSKGFNPWKLAHEEDRLRQRLLRELRELKQTLILLEEQEHQRLEAALETDKGFLRTLRRFNGSSLYGWECASGSDLRVAKLPLQFGGWVPFRQVIWRIRRATGIWPAR